MANISKIKLPNGTSYNIKDSNAIPTSNIVTTINSSSTDTTVPSAKAVYTAIANAISAAIAASY